MENSKLLITVNSKLSEILSSSYQDKKRIAEILLSRFDNYDCYDLKVTKEIYKKELSNALSEDEINIVCNLDSNEINDTLKALYERRNKVKKYFKAFNIRKEYLQGKEIYNCSKNLEFRAMFELTSNQLRGFVEAVGSWNNFNPVTIIAAVKETEKKIPSGGTFGHKWKIYNDYIILDSNYVTGDTFSKWMELEEDLAQIWKNTEYDSFRHEIEKDSREVPVGVNYIFWWD